jgi:hypothetical protein
MSEYKIRDRRPGRVNGVVVVIIIIIAVIIARQSRDNGTRFIEPSVDSTGKYVPTGDEGLGASIAIVLDVSGSMKDNAEGDKRPKYLVAREALATMLAQTDSFVARQPGFPVNVGLFTFNSSVHRIVPIKPYNRDELLRALRELGEPSGGTAIGDAMDAARTDLYSAGTIRKYILVVTDGANTDGREPEDVAQEIFTRSEGAVRQYFVAFDIDEGRFAFLRRVNGEVLGAANGVALRASLDSIYRGKILAESMDAGETLPTAARRDTGTSSRKQ